MSQRNRKSIRAAGVGRNLSARGMGKPLWTNLNEAVEDCYSERERNEDFLLLPDTQPIMARPRPNFYEQFKPMPPSQRSIELREQLEEMNFIKAFMHGTRTVSPLPGREPVADFMVQPGRELQFLPVTDAPKLIEGKDEWNVNAKAEAVRHAAWLAKEKAEMVARREAANVD